MKILKILMAVITLCTAVCFTACSGGGKAENTAQTAASPAASALVGTWKGTGDEPATITFSPDGQVRDETIWNDTSIVIAGPYSVDEAEGTVSVHDDEDGLDFTYHYTIDGDDLTLLNAAGGLPRTFQKVK